MTTITWDDVGKRYYHTGIDRGVLYVDGYPGVPWNGLTSITKVPSGGESKPYYVDGVKFSNNASIEEYEATVTALTYPEEFEVCDGTAEPRPGMFITGQRRKSFGLCYRTTIGNDLAEKDYQLNLIYNASAAPTTRGHKTHNDSIQVIEFMWKITALAPAISGYRSSPHVVIDSRYADATALAGIESILYGTPSSAPRLPTFVELLDIYDTANKLTVVNNGDGTFTMTAPDYALAMLDSSTFQLNWPTATFVDSNTYTASSG